MEENQIMTNRQLESRLKSLRFGDRLFKLLGHCATAAIVLMLLIMSYLMCVLFLIAAIAFVVLHSSCSTSIKKLLNDNIISGVLKEILGDSVEYNPGDRISTDKSVVPYSYNKVEGSDHIKAVYKGLNIELSDIELINESETVTQDEDGHSSTEKTSETVFKGQWLICDFGKELAGELHLYPTSKLLRMLNLSGNVQMESEAFNKRFSVNAQNAEEAFYILTPHMMEYILTMADRSGGKDYLSFMRNGKMHIAVDTGRDFFELGRSKANVDQLRRKFLDELRWFTDIIDTLRVKDTLYKKTDA